MAWRDFMLRILDEAAAEETIIKVAAARDYAQAQAERWDEYAVEKGLIRGGEEE